MSLTRVLVCVFGCSQSRGSAPDPHQACDQRSCCGCVGGGAEAALRDAGECFTPPFVCVLCPPYSPLRVFFCFTAHTMVLPQCTTTDRAPVSSPLPLPSHHPPRLHNGMLNIPSFRTPSFPSSAVIGRLSAKYQQQHCRDPSCPLLPAACADRAHQEG